MSEERWFRVASIVHLALVPAHDDEDPIPAVDVPAPNAWTERTRQALNRVRLPGDTREAMYAIIDGLQHLERELHDLRRTLALERRGVQLKPELVLIGGDGMQLQRDAGFENDARVHCYLSIRVWDSDRLMTVTARATSTDDGTELLFEQLGRDQRDALVGFCFQQQGKERRRELDSADS